MKPSTPEPHPGAAALNHASRRVVRALGLLERAPREPGFTRTGARALAELGRAGELTAGELAAILGLDKSTASRLVAELTRRGHVGAGQGGGDKRRKPLRLTARGRARAAALDAEGDALSLEALSMLGEAEGRAAIEGVALYALALERVERARGFEVRPIARRDDAAVAAVIRAVMTEFGASGPGFAIHDPEVDAMHDAYRPPRAGYFVVDRGGRVLGGAGFGPLEGGGPGVCELRKMYYLPEARGLGLGRLALERVIVAAEAAGYHTMYLETFGTMKQARKLYEATGFRELGGPMGSTGHFGCDAYFAKTLGGGRAAPAEARGAPQGAAAADGRGARKAGARAKAPSSAQAKKA